MNNIPEIEILKSYIEVYKRIGFYTETVLTKRFLELIEKTIEIVEDQQSDIEDLKETIDRKNQTLKDLKIMAVDRDSIIEKYKIREKIKEIDGQGTFDAKIVLEHLLEEK